MKKTDDENSVAINRVRKIAIIPVRLRSTRLARKALISVAGKPLIVHTVENALLHRQAGVFDELYVATDSQEIAKVLLKLPVETIPTVEGLESGSARIADALRHIPRRYQAEVIVNIQGDEPRISLSAVRSLLSAYRCLESNLNKPLGNASQEPAWFKSQPEMATLCCPLSQADADAPQTVKVVRTVHDRALYFSRNAIPYTGSHIDARKTQSQKRSLFCKHIGIYAYRRDFIENTYSTLSPTPLEMAENLEQLRVLEHGYRIQVCEIAEKSIDINVSADITAFAELLKREQAGQTNPR